MEDMLSILVATMLPIVQSSRRMLVEDQWTKIFQMEGYVFRLAISSYRPLRDQKNYWVSMNKWKQTCSAVKMHCENSWTVCYVCDLLYCWSRDWSDATSLLLVLLDRVRNLWVWKI